jgi:NAD(P)-dependent dehydrogenase (short-subunit alcohol dehydrogenase family)
VVIDLCSRFGAANVVGKACEISKFDDVQALWDLAKNAYGRVDVWVNNAGITIASRPIYEADAADLQNIVNTNLLGMLLTNKVAMAGMKQQGSGQIWNMEGFGSNGMVRAGMAPYGATKRAVNYLNKSLRKDAAGTGVKVCALSPGIVVTDLLIGEYDMQSEQWQKTKKVFNILADTVDTVTPWLVDGVLASDKDGARVEWLTTPKVIVRFLKASFVKRDLFAGMDS